MSKNRQHFGTLLLRKRVDNGYCLRNSMGSVRIAPTCLPLIVAGMVKRLPTAEREQMEAEFLGERPDQWIARQDAFPMI